MPLRFPPLRHDLTLPTAVAALSAAAGLAWALATTLRQLAAALEAGL